MLTSSQVVLVLSAKVEPLFRGFFMENPDLREELDKNLSHAKIMDHEDGSVLFAWSTVFWDRTNEGIKALENLLVRVFSQKEYKFIKIGEEINDMVCWGELDGPPFYVGYQRRIVFIDTEERTRYVSAGALVE